MARLDRQVPVRPAPIKGEGDDDDPQDVARQHPADRREDEQNAPHERSTQPENEEERAGDHREQRAEAGARLLDEQRSLRDADDVAVEHVDHAEAVEHGAARHRCHLLHAPHQLTIQAERQRHEDPEERPGRKQRPKEDEAAQREQPGRENQLQGDDRERRRIDRFADREHAPGRHEERERGSEIVGPARCGTPSRPGQHGSAEDHERKELVVRQQPQVIEVGRQKRRERSQRQEREQPFPRRRRVGRRCRNRSAGDDRHPVRCGRCGAARLRSGFRICLRAHSVDSNLRSM